MNLYEPLTLFFVDLSAFLRCDKSTKPLSAIDTLLEPAWRYINELEEAPKNKA